MNYHAQLRDAYSVAVYAAYDEINELADLHGRWGLTPAHPLPHALGYVLSGWQEYNRQPFIHGVTENLRVLLVYEVGKALWQRRSPSAGNGD